MSASAVGDQSAAEPRSESPRPGAGAFASRWEGPVTDASLARAALAVAAAAAILRRWNSTLACMRGGGGSGLRFRAGECCWRAHQAEDDGGDEGVSQEYELRRRGVMNGPARAQFARLRMPTKFSH